MFSCQLLGVAVIGISVMFWGGGVLGIGEVLMFSDAVLYAVYTLVLERVAQRHPSLSLTSVQLFVIAVLGAFWSNTEIVSQFETISKNWSVILYLGLVATAIVIWLQTLAQQWIRAEEAALLYTLEPIFSAIFSFWLLGEQLGKSSLIGAVLILFAIVLSQTPQNFKADVRKPSDTDLKELTAVR